MDKVSVILTTYNSEVSLQRTINSILTQNGINNNFILELIVVDDCSTDRTREILKENNISFYSTGSRSGGPNKGRNIGLSIANGDFISFIDHDDTWEPDKTMLQLEMAHTYPIVSAGYQLINQNLNRIINCYHDNSKPIIYQKNETFRKILLRERDSQNVYLSSLLIDKSLKNTLFEEHFGMLDFDWLLRLFENNISCEIPRCLLTRFVTEKNLSLNVDYRRKDYNFGLYILERYKKQYPFEVRKAIKRINGTIGRYYYLTNDMKNSREHMLKSGINAKMLAYLITSFAGSSYIRKKFHFFG